MSSPFDFFFNSNEFWDKMQFEVVLALLDPVKLQLLLSNGVSINLLMNIVHSTLECCAPVVLENQISAALGVKESSFCRDAVNMASIYSQIQNYAFHQLRVVKMFSYFARVTIPRFLLPAFRISQKNNLNEKEILSSYSSSFYNKGAIYSVLVQGFIRDYCNCFTVNAVEFADFFSSFFSKTVAKKPSVIRKVKKLAFINCSMALDCAFSFLLRCIGAKIGMFIGRNRHSPMSIFFFQNFFLIATHAFALVAISKASEKLLYYFNRFFPPTPEEIEEEEREHKSTEERENVFVRISEFSENRNESLYSILGIDPTSDLNAIRASYRAQSLKFHPDRVQKTVEAQKEAQERMSRVNQAYEILQDPEKRAFYDLTISSTENKIFGKEIGEVSTTLKSTPVLIRVPLVFGAVAGLFYSGILFSYASTYKVFRYVTQPGMCWNQSM